MKIKMTKKKADILNWIFTIIAYALLFWADWKIGLGVMLFDISRSFEYHKGIFEQDIK